MTESTGEVETTGNDEKEKEEEARPGRLDRIAPAIAAIALALPTLLTYYPPMSDLPLHEGVVGVMRHYRDPEYFPDDLYYLNLGHPNQLFHVVSWAFSLLLGTRWAVKIVIALSQVAIFHAGTRFADHLGRSRWSVMLLTPLALGFTYYWGLVANLLGFSTLLYALPIFDRMVESPTRKAILQACGVLVLIFFAHESAFLLGTGVIALFAITRPLRLRETALRLAPVVFATTLGLGNFFYQRAGVEKTKTIFTTLNVAASWFPLRQKVEMVPQVLFGSHDPPERLMLFGLALVGVATFIVARARHDEAASLDTSDRFRLRRLAFRFRYELVAATFLLLYFTMPFNFKGITLLHERFLGPAWAVFVIAVAPRKLNRLAPIAAAALPIAVLFVSWPQFESASRSYRSLELLMDKIPKGSTVTSCVLERPGGPNLVRVFSAGPGPARTLATRGGRASFNNVGSPIAPVRMRGEYVWDEYDVRTFLYGSRSLSPSFDLQRWEYVLAESRDPDLRAALKDVLGPEATLVAADGEWMLLHSNLTQVSPASGSVIPPRAALEDTILHRMIKRIGREVEVEGER